MANLSNINGKFVVEQTTGFVGIGTTDPEYLLHVNSSDVTNGTRLIIENTNGSGKKYGLISDNTGVFTVRDVTAGADRFSISNLGDATFTGDVTISQPTNASDAILNLTSKSGAGNSRTSSIKYDADVEKILFINEGATIAAMTSDIKVGIGIDSPDAKFHVDSGQAHGEIKLTTSTLAGYDATLSLIAGNSTGASVLNLGYDGDDDYSRIFRDSSGNLKFSNNNDTKLTIDSSGNVGIGVAADTSVRTFIKGSDSGTNNFQILTRNSSDENVLAVRNDGKVGIGTTSPDEQFTVGGSGTQGRIGLNTTGVDHPYIQMTQFGSPNTNVVVRIDAGGNSYFNGGNVGIGTDSPTGARLFVASSGTDPQILVKNTAGNNAQILFEDNDGGTQNASITFDQAGQNTLTIATGYNSPTDLNRINIAPAGNVGLTVRGGTGGSGLGQPLVGIGTTSPGAKLSLYHATDDVSINVNTGAGGSYPKKTGISFGATSTSLGSDAKFTGGAGIQAINTAASGNPTDLTFWTNSVGTPSERMRIDSSGNVAIGWSGTNNYKLYILDGVNRGTSDAQIHINGNGYSGFHYLDATGYHIQQNSDYRSLILISGTSGGVKLTAGATAWVSNSDVSLKENLKPLDNVLDKIKDYRCVEYNLKNAPYDKKIGFIAQDWKNDFAPIVNKDEEGLLGMKYTETIPVLLKAIQELKAEIEILKKK